MNSRRVKLIKKDLFDILGYPKTATEIKNFNKTFKAMREHYAKTKQMPKDLLKAANA